MKGISFGLMMLISLAVLSSDWDLFPFRQKTFYNNNVTGNYKYADLFVMDSIRVSGQDTVLFFRRNLNLQGAGNCYTSTLQAMPYTIDDFYNIDSLVQRRDTVFYHWNLSTKPFYFLPKASPGQSWTVISDYGLNDYNQITVTCSGVQLETFLGITDSVKTFTMTPNGSSSNQIPITNFVMKLSKNHGLIAFVPFVLFLYHPNTVDFTSLELIGLDSLGTEHGYKQPKFSDYFHLAVGDILLWKREVIPDWIISPAWSEYYRDSITQAVNTPDSVLYTFSRMKKDTDNIITQYSGLTTVFRKSELTNIVETPPCWIGFGNNQFGQSFSVNHVLYWRSSFLELTIGSVNADTSTAYHFITDYSIVDTTDCMLYQAFDISSSFTIDTRAGVTQYCSNNFGSNCVTLIGSKIAGHQTGSITLSVNNPITATTNDLKIYPNPSTDEICIDNLTHQKFGYQIYSATGQLFQQGICDDHKIDIAGLHSGLYFIRIQMNEKNIFGKFIKQ